MKKKLKSATAERFIAEIQSVIDSGIANNFSHVAKASGYTSQDFTDIKAGKKDVKRDFLDAVADKFLIDKNYILTGEKAGNANVTKENYPLSNKESATIANVTPSKTNDINQRVNVNGGETRDSRKGWEYKALPGKQQYNAKDMSTEILKWIDPNHLPIPVFDSTYGVESISELLKNDAYKPTVILLKGHLGCHAVVRHIDSAMNKHFPARCQLGIERLKTFKKRIEPGKPYIVVLEELTVTRYVFETDKHFILRSSDVELYPDMPVDKEEILEMWRIRSLTPIPDQQLF